ALQALHARSHGIEPSCPVLHRFAPFLRRARTVEELRHDRHASTNWLQFVTPTVVPALLLYVSPRRLPGDAPAGLVLDDVVVHLVVAELLVVHLHRKDITDSRHDRVR